jgi:hypothetical protein
LLVETGLNVAEHLLRGIGRPVVADGGAFGQSDQLVEKTDTVVEGFPYTAAFGLFQSVIAFILIVVVNHIAKRLGAASLW